MLRESRAKGNTSPTLSMQDAAKALMAFEILVLMGDAFGIDCSELIIEIKEILGQYPELWGSIDEPVELLLAEAS